MIDTWNPAKLNEKISGRDSWNPAILNESVTDRDSWNPSILNESDGETPIEFEATITASFPEGATCTATDGTTTLTSDDNPMAFNIPNEGTWAVACLANGVTFSENVVITTNGQTETIDLTPVGDTYATTDSVPVLIACAGIGDSEITTIAGALADVETLTAILESENAIDYLVRSTTFASDVTSDSVAMTGIGAINYDADTLLADSTWRTAICNSAYFESVLNVKVPTMTSATTPSGEVIYSTAGDLAPWLAFDGNSSTRGNVPNAVGQYIGYKFDTSKKIYKAVIKFYEATTEKFIAKGSNDGATWNEISTTITGGSEVTVDIDGTNSYTRFALFETQKITDNTNSTFYEIQFYGRQDVNV